MKKIGEMNVMECMTVDVVTVQGSELLTHAIRRMENESLSVLPVVDESGKLRGLLSATDLITMVHEVQSDLGALSIVKAATKKVLLQLLQDQGDSTRVQDVMTSPVESVYPDTNIIVAARKMSEFGYHHLPVIDEDRFPVGILSTMDIVRTVAEAGATLAG